MCVCVCVCVCVFGVSVCVCYHLIWIGWVMRSQEYKDFRVKMYGGEDMPLLMDLLGFVILNC